MPYVVKQQANLAYGNLRMLLMLEICIWHTCCMSDQRDFATEELESSVRGRLKTSQNP